MNHLPKSISTVNWLMFKAWNAIPGLLQKWMSTLYTKIYDTSWSRHLIPLYCRLSYSDPSYLDKFVSNAGNKHYRSFQDFFTRRFKEPPTLNGPSVWPCEGILCEKGKIDKLPEVTVKGQKQALRQVFGAGGPDIPKNYYFSNVFLHNQHYHRIHAPVKGRITRIEHIPGSLQLLRPWFYKKNPSYPALTNERVNVDLSTPSGETWYLSIVGGPAVRTIVMSDGMKIGTEVEVGEEIAIFLLGSTCCIASPIPPQNSRVGSMVVVGLEY